MIKIGDQIKVDGIDCTVFYIDEEKCWAVDNHGAGYYENGVEDRASAIHYEWGAFNISTGATGTGMGSGISNTNTALANENSFISVKEGTQTIWEALNNLRSQRSDIWFIPSNDELREAYDIIPNKYSTPIWSSTEVDASKAKSLDSAGYTSNKDSTRFLRLICTLSINNVDASIEMSQEDGADIRYTDDGTDPSESSTLYTSPVQAKHGDTIKARAYLNDSTLPSDIASITIDTTPITKTENIPVCTELENGYIAYDRGEEYGDYNLSNGKLTRISDGTDDGSIYSENWRFLVIQKNILKLPDNVIWGPNILEDVKSIPIGYGKQNTEKMIGKYNNVSDYIWYYIYLERLRTGIDLFLPSSQEAGNISDNLAESGIIPSGMYVTSSEYSATDINTGLVNIGSGSNIKKNIIKNYPAILMYRI